MHVCRSRPKIPLVTIALTFFLTHWLLFSSWEEWIFEDFFLETEISKYVIKMFLDFNMYVATFD